ncbi:uncharacterized protein LOC132713479 isoform X2 [Ruditapes philippinarum]|uniref:uncharacterized protein LOC132713479 isoform X2 n=1 Tax=Ruditapes philippinarum TaxID=129788 RepID=UPI00295BB2FF|nr:uncharacterized protein LOC132713479 isoform X2 [Ruditapes philippinarum]
MCFNVLHGRSPYQLNTYGQLQKSTKKSKMKYDRTNLLRAFEATKMGMSVYRASREYNIPESTLRDRSRGLVPIDAKVGFKPIFSSDEEQRLVEHISYMANIGYGYNASKIKFMAREYAINIGKSVKSTQHLSDNWFYDFLKRWPKLDVAKAQKPSISRETVENYCAELETILNENNLFDKPERIFMIDENIISTEHRSPNAVCSPDTNLQDESSSQSSLVTIIAGGNAIGNCIPPYYVFPGKRWNPEFLRNTSVGSSGEMTKNGLTNTEVIQNYVTKHFVNYANLSPDKPALLLYDGHKSHIKLTCTQWVSKNNVIIFVLPPHTSLVTQPMDNSVFAPFKRMYCMVSHAYMEQNPGRNISMYSVAELTAYPYTKAVSTENLQSAFRNAGIFPLDKTTIAKCCSPDFRDSSTPAVTQSDGSELNVGAQDPDTNNMLPNNICELEEMKECFQVGAAISNKNTNEYKDTSEPQAENTTNCKINKGIITQRSLAIKIIDEHGIILVPEMGAFMVRGNNDKKYVVTVFPEETCSCPATSRCCHIVAAMMAIGMPVPGGRKS